MLNIPDIDSELNALGQVPDDLVVPMNISDDLTQVDAELGTLAEGVTVVEEAPPRPWYSRMASTPPPVGVRPSSPPARKSEPQPAPAKRESRRPAERKSEPQPTPAKRESRRPAERKSQSPSARKSKRPPARAAAAPSDAVSLDAETEALLGPPATPRADAPPSRSSRPSKPSVRDLDAETEALLSEPPPPAGVGTPSQPPKRTDISELLDEALDPNEFPQTPISPPSIPAAALARPSRAQPQQEEGFELLVDDDDILEIDEDDLES